MAAPITARAAAISAIREGEQSGPQPAVWILNAEDQPRGRQLLRDAGLLESTRIGESSYLSLTTLHEVKAPAARKSNMRTRMRIGLLVLIVVVSALIWYSRREASPTPATKRGMATAPAAPKHAPPAIIPQQAEDLEVYRADVPTALAKLLIEGEIAKTKPARACIAIDGADPAPQFIESLVLGGATEAFSASDCPQDVGVEDHGARLHDRWPGPWPCATGVRWRQATNGRSRARRHPLGNPFATLSVSQH